MEKTIKKERKNWRCREPLEYELERHYLKFDENFASTSYNTHLVISTGSRSTQTNCRQLRGDHFVGD